MLYDENSDNRRTNYQNQAFSLLTEAHTRSIREMVVCRLHSCDFSLNSTSGGGEFILRNQLLVHDPLQACA